MANQEKEFTDELKCGHCQNTVHMEVMAKYTANKSFSNGPESWETVTYYYLCKCPACERVTLRQTVWQDHMDPEEVVWKTLYPQNRDLRGLPPKIQLAFTAALKVRSIEVNAYGVLIGRLLDLVCEDRAATGKSLDQRLKNLATRGEIPTNLVEVAAGLRRLRNIGAHANLGELTDTDLPVLDNLTRAILEYVYTAPLLAKEAEERFALLTGDGPSALA